MWADDIIVSENIRIGCTHEYARVAFSDLSTLGPLCWIRLDKKLI